MELNKYSKQAYAYAKYRFPDYCFLALAEEAGEVCGKLAKHSRKHNVTLNDMLVTIENDPTLKEDLMKELGDVLWQLNACATEIGSSLQEIADMNLAKLSDRSKRGTLIGEGDNR